MKADPRRVLNLIETAQSFLYIWDDRTAPAKEITEAADALRAALAKIEG